MLCFLASGVQRGCRSRARHGKGNQEAVWLTFTLSDERGQCDKIKTNKCIFYRDFEDISGGKFTKIFNFLVKRTKRVKKMATNSKFEE